MDKEMFERGLAIRRQVLGEDGVDGVILGEGAAARIAESRAADRGDVAVVHNLPRHGIQGKLSSSIQRRLHRRGSIWINWRIRGNQELVIQERSAERRMKEVVAQRVLLCQQSFRQSRRIEIAQH